MSAQRRAKWVARVWDLVAVAVSQRGVGGLGARVLPIRDAMTIKIVAADEALIRVEGLGAVVQVGRDLVAVCVIDAAVEEVLKAGDQRAKITSVAVTIPVAVPLVSVRGVGTTIQRVRDEVAVAIGELPKGLTLVANLVAIAVSLVRVKNARAVVARLADPVGVTIGLLSI